jgi:hypothetical protein
MRQYVGRVMRYEREELARIMNLPCGMMLWASHGPLISAASLAGRHSLGDSPAGSIASGVMTPAQALEVVPKEDRGHGELRWAGGLLAGRWRSTLRRKKYDCRH